MTVEEIPMRSPLAGWKATFPGVHVEEIPFLTQLGLRVRPGGAAAEAVAKALGGELPAEPCTASRMAGLTVLWLGPDEWLVLAEPGRHGELGSVSQLGRGCGGAQIPPGGVPWKPGSNPGSWASTGHHQTKSGPRLAPTPVVKQTLEDQLRAAIGDEHGAVVDVSAQRTALHLSGAAARDVLARGCAIDFDPRVTPPGTCVQTMLARTGATILVRDDRATDFLLLVRASFAQYLAAWLHDACADTE